MRPAVQPSVSRISSSQKNFREHADILPACSRRQTHAFHPISHAASEFDFSAAGSDSLGLQVNYCRIIRARAPYGTP
jgi:hypothetical protein